MEFIQKKRATIFLLCSSLIILALVIHVISYHIAKNASKDILTTLSRTDSLQLDILKATGIDSAQNKILKNQYFVCQQIKNYYSYLTKSYYINYYSFSICSIIFTTLLTIALFLITNNGWRNADIILKSFFLTTLLITSVYHFLPQVLSSKDNFHQNVLKVKKFQKIQLDILTLQSAYDHTNKHRIDSALISNYKQISDNYDLITIIDNSKLEADMNDILKSINKP